MVTPHMAATATAVPGGEDAGLQHEATRRRDLAGLRPAGRGAQRRVGRLLVHGLSPGGSGPGKSPEQNRAEKEVRVSEGRAHAALVYDDEACVGWCQFGVPDELPRIKNRRAYLDGLNDLPDWRITCFFVDRGRRNRGVSSAALAGALEEIGRLGGGTVESYPDEVDGRSVSASFLHNGTLALFERQGSSGSAASARPAGWYARPSGDGGTRDSGRRRTRSRGDDMATITARQPSEPCARTTRWRIQHPLSPTTRRHRATSGLPRPRWGAARCARRRTHGSSPRSRRRGSRGRTTGCRRRSAGWDRTGRAR